MNPVIILTRNCLALTQQCIASVLEQDIPVTVHVVDNGSTDGTLEYLVRGGYLLDAAENNAGVSRGWNRALSHFFDEMRLKHALVLNNDTIIPPHFYRSLIDTGELFISGVSIEPAATTYWSCGQEFPLPEDKYKNPHPDFSAFLIRKQCWDRVGPFDEMMVHYAQDCDYHVRMNRCGIWAGSINLPFHHYRSSTVKQAPDSEKAEICARAEADRMWFKEKYGCEIGSPGYDRLFKEVTEHARAETNRLAMPTI